MVIVPIFMTTTVCMVVSQNVSRQDIQGIDNEVSLGVTNITQYDDALYRLGQMLDAYGCSDALVQVRQISNETASKKLPADVSQLTITALNKIGTHIQIVDYDSDQLGIDLAIGTHTMQRVVPDLALRGAITEFDKKIEKERGVGVDVSSKTFGTGSDAGIGGSLDGRAAGTTTAMDFQLIDYQTQTLLPGVQAANRINVFDSSSGGGLDLSFVGSRGNFRSSASKSQGIHASLRLLVELCIGELVGKYNLVPYWRCIPGADPDPVLINNYQRQIAASRDRLLIMKKLAVAHGYLVDPFSTHVSESEADIFMRIRQNLGVAPNASDVDLITALWLTVPIQQGAENMQQYYVLRQDEELARQQALAEQQRLEQERLAEAQRKEAEKQKKRTTFKFGTQDTF